jgi:hypothetical protein
MDTFQENDQSQRFGGIVRKHADPEIPRRYVEEAIRDFQTEGRTHRGAAPDCILRVKELWKAQADQYREWERKRTSGPENLEGTEEVGISDRQPDNQALSTRLLDYLLPGVQELRKELFPKSGSEPPYRSLEKATKWIERQAHLETPGQFSDQVLRYPDTRHARTRNGQLVYPGARAVPIPPGSPLVKLKQYVQQASRVTGYREAALVDFVLTGRPHVLPRVSISRGGLIPSHRGAGVVKTSVFTITLRAQKVIWEDLRAAFKAIDRIQRSETAGLSEPSLAVVAAIKRLGGVPPRGKRKFWKKVSESEEVAPYKLRPENVDKRYRRFPEELRRSLVQE